MLAMIDGATVQKVLFVVALAVGAHVIVLAIRTLSRRMMVTSYPRRIADKARTVQGLVVSMLVFGIYFSAIGLILSEFGVSLAAYFASTTIIGLAVGFGSQGMVQDVVMGLTAIFTDLFDVGDMVEVSGQVGIVQEVGMRFTTLRNALGADVLIPNRSIVNVVRFPRGYVRCFVDITVAEEDALAADMERTARGLTDALLENYPGIFRAPAEVMGVQRSGSGRRFMRIKLRIWPGRGGPIEGTFKQEVVQALKALDAGYADWMVSVNYEVEEARPLGKIIA